MKKARRSIGVLTSGGDCPGLNAVIRGIVKRTQGCSMGPWPVIEFDRRVGRVKTTEGWDHCHVRLPVRDMVPNYDWHKVTLGKSDLPDLNHQLVHDIS